MPDLRLDQHEFGGVTKTFSLVAAPARREVLFVLDTGSVHTGTVTINVTSTNKRFRSTAPMASGRSSPWRCPRWVPTGPGSR